MDVKCSAGELPGGACVPRGLLLVRVHGSVPGTLVGVAVTLWVVPGEDGRGRVVVVLQSVVPPEVGAPERVLVAGALVGAVLAQWL